MKARDEIYIQSYKHDGSLHRTWAKGYVLEVTEERIVLVTNHTVVSEADGRRWLTREPAVCFFYKEKWFNVISMIRRNGIHYYCNIASPSIYDGEALKNIDYDLDVKMSSGGKITILDEDEYDQHAKKMGYSEELKEILERTVNEVVYLMEDEESPFNVEEVEFWFQKYLEYIQKSEE